MSGEIPNPDQESFPEWSLQQIRNWSGGYSLCIMHQQEGEGEEYYIWPLAPLPYAKDDDLCADDPDATSKRLHNYYWAKASYHLDAAEEAACGDDRPDEVEETTLERVVQEVPAKYHDMIATRMYNIIRRLWAAAESVKDDKELAAAFRTNMAAFIEVFPDKISDFDFSKLKLTRQ